MGGLRLWSRLLLTLAMLGGGGDRHGIGASQLPAEQEALSTLPRLLLLGAQKAGTTAVAHYFVTSNRACFQTMVRSNNDGSQEPNPEQQAFDENALRIFVNKKEGNASPPFVHG